MAAWFLYTYAFSPTNLCTKLHALRLCKHCWNIGSPKYLIKKISLNRFKKSTSELTLPHCALWDECADSRFGLCFLIRPKLFLLMAMLIFISDGQYERGYFVNCTISCFISKEFSLLVFWSLTRRKPHDFLCVLKLGFVICYDQILDVVKKCDMFLCQKVMWNSGQKVLIMNDLHSFFIVGFYVLLLQNLFP